MLQKLKLLNAWQKILLSMLCGGLVGLLFPQFAGYLKILGTLFLNLIKMVTIPLIFFTIIFGITNIKSTEGLYKTSIKAVILFIITAACATLIGIACAHLMQPGANKSPSLVTSEHSSIPKAADAKSLITNLVPSNLISAMVEGNIIQIILAAFFIGIVLQKHRDSNQELISICHQVANLMLQLIRYIMLLAPLGVFGYVADLIATEGLSIVMTLGQLILTICLGCLIQYLLFAVLIMVWGKMSPIPFFYKTIEAQMIAFSTSSSKAALVSLMDAAENRLGISKQNTRFLLPLASSLNMDGGAIYQAVCAIFFAQVFGLNLAIADYVTLLFMCTIASIGGAGIPGGVLLFLGMVLSSIGLPAQGVLLIATVDRILDMVTTLVNITGDACLTLLIDKSEKRLNLETYYNMNYSKENDK